MGGAATARERQAALRANRRKDGLKYIHVWASPDQEEAIKAYLGDPTAQPLHVTRDTHDDGLEEKVRRLHFDLQLQQNEIQSRRAALASAEVELEQRRRDIESREARIDEKHELAESAYRQYTQWQEEASQTLEAIRLREAELDKKERALKAAGARLEKSSQNQRVTDKERIEALAQRFTTRPDYSQPGIPRVPIQEGYQIEARAKEITKLTTKTRSVSTSLSGLAKEFKELLGDKEIADLEDAVGVLNRIGQAAAATKKTTLALEKSIKAHEQVRARQAHQAAQACLAGLDERDVVLHLCIMEPGQYDLEEFLSCKPRYRSMTELLSEVHRATQGNVKYQIEKRLKAGQGVEDAKAFVMATIAERMPEAQDTYGPRIRQAIAAVIAERLGKANG